MVKQSLNTIPERIAVSGRDGARSMILEDHKSYYGTGSDCPFILDSFTGERRTFTKNDVETAARIADALPNIDFHMSLGLTSDVPNATYDRHQFVAMLSNTTKPLILTCMSRQGLADIVEMCHAVRGGEEEFRRNPFFVLYDEPSTPLLHSKEAVQKLLFAAEHGVPAIYTPCPICGATATSTLAGALVTACAEFFVGAVLSQLKRPGAPVIMGGVASVMDMSTTILSYGAPELSLLSAALTDIAHHLRIPMFSTGGCSDSKSLDQQAASEATLSLLTSSLSGANIIHDIGYLESALVGSFDMLVMCDEIIGMVKRIIRGVRVDKETLAVDLIDAVGPGGNFLAEDHTYKHFKKEFWFPTLMDRSKHDAWSAAGKPTLADRISDKVKDIVENHQVAPLPDDVREEIARILARADAKAGGA